MIEFAYSMLLVLFAIGAGLILLINRRNSDARASQNWVKYLTYLVLVNAIWMIAAYQSSYFYYLTLLIALAGLAEIVRAMLVTGRSQVGIISLVVYVPLAYMFSLFGELEKHFLLYTIFLVVIFDAFCQLTGQLWGRTKFLPIISPNKTIEGLLGGLLAATLASVLVKDLLSLQVLESILLGLALAVFAFVGDLLASWSKRRFGIKDFGGILPGHGGILDRFDSWITAAPGILLVHVFLF